MTLSTLKTLQFFLEHFSNYELIHEQKSYFNLVEETILIAFSLHLIPGQKKQKNYQQRKDKRLVTMDCDYESEDRVTQVSFGKGI